MKVPTVIRACFSVVIAFTVILLMPACEEDPTKSGLPPQRIEIESGNNQIDRITAHLPEPLVVKVSNQIGDPMMGIMVTFSTDDLNAEVNPPEAATDASGLASCQFRLGTEPGEQHVKALIAEDSTTFTITAEDFDCPEEEPSGFTLWPENHIYITTSHSSLLHGTGSVVIDYDPGSGAIVEVLETTKLLIDISFSPRGEMYVTTDLEVFKVDHGTKALEEEAFGTYPAAGPVELKPNTGGILSGVSVNGPFFVDCPSTGIVQISLPVSLQYVLPENLAEHPVTRHLYLITGQGPPTFLIYRMPWDGRFHASFLILHTSITGVRQAFPKGMCIDSTGTKYITVSGDDTYQRIVKVSYDGTVDDEFIDLFAIGGNARWGDIAYLTGKLYLIDTLNDRLGVFTDTGELDKFVEDKAFSTVSSTDERYGIDAIP
ncbi:MAG: hypothetical protein JSV33_05080 [bacterium]|nr:MAG: hypothetical protein JSV33_05080 [bacterium]